ncbi:DNA-3-methyladenine glycosylase I [Corynebacterium tapiri]|uniref:DNA-3-methyladenine glycosylase I n=1 Tax=Corynebacterium tapiri TaxID=1448266 RepID=A0A5C4U6A4_9CORY|nr:DNA-3-methyladenine glycosylase I [Corynebacterium tapiri]TNM00435.1 DNA-3-methyladenine glycosylase I [Corynebacterium tapiri]
MHNSPDLITGPDGLARTPWAYGTDLLTEYYDTEWGMPIYEESGLFERLCLESFQAGLSWSTILNKREAFRRAFLGFDVDAVAQMTPQDVKRLLLDASIIRNEKKIQAAITNARATVELRSQEGLSELIWSFRPETTPEPMSLSEVPSSSAESKALARELKSRGFAFVGPTSMYALMEAIGMVDTHLMGSHRRGCSGLWPR